jgi:zinc protease
MMRGFLLAWMMVMVACGAQAFPPVEAITTPKGITLWYMGHHEVPVVSSIVTVRGIGAFEESETQSGLTTVMARMLGEGAGGMSAEDFQVFLDERGIELSASSQPQGLTLLLKTLSSRVDEAYPKLADMLLRPAMPPEAFARVKAQLLAGWEAMQQDPGALANIAWWKGAFPTHPCGRHGQVTPQSTGNISLAQVRDFEKNGLYRQRIQVVMVGDISKEKAISLVDAAFGALPPEPKAYAYPAAVPMAKGGDERLAVESPQAAVMFGLPAVPRTHPDFYALNLLTHLFGSGNFSSLMMKRLREENGLVYGASADYVFHPACPVLTGFFSTRPENTAKAIGMFRTLVKEVAAGNFTQAQLDDTRSNLLGNFALGADSTGRLAAILSTMQANNVGPEHLQSYVKHYQAVTVDDLKRVAATWLKADALRIVSAEPASLPKPTDKKKNQP